jgi:large subunit ribosomal protein L23
MHMPATKKTTKKVEAPAKRSAKVLSELARAVALAPLMTEKTAHLSGSSVYAFRVASDANRVAVAKAFREMYGVLPTRVNVLRVHGKEKRFGRTAFRQSDWKKVYISVPTGTTLDLFATV